MIQQRQELTEVLQRVQQWPPALRISLARQILQTVEATTASEKRGYSAEEVISFLNMPQPAPDDAECDRILEDERMRKYGS